MASFYCSNCDSGLNVETIREALTGVVGCKSCLNDEEVPFPFESQIVLFEELTERLDTVTQKVADLEHQLKLKE